jgi:hypothetical protein
VVVEERLLHAEEAVLALRPGARVGLEEAALLRVRVVVLVGEREPELDVLRPEGGVALDQRALAISVSLKKVCSVSPKTSLLPESPLWMPTGTGVERGS